jgi:nucleoside-diphosphate-sugar epimerase
MTIALGQQSGPHDSITGKQDLILVTGAGGFIGAGVVECLLRLGFANVRCFVRKQSSACRLRSHLGRHFAAANVEIIQGNLLSREDCIRATCGVKIVFHLAAGSGEKSYPDAFMNSVVTTRNLIEALLPGGHLRRFVNISSFSVYSNQHRAGAQLDESCPVEECPELRGDAYTFAKVRQDGLVIEYGARFALPYVIVRPGHVYGPGNLTISGRVGIDTFGRFLHLGGPNTIPLTYIDNCAEAIVLAGLRPSVEREVFNVVDDDLPTSRYFLRQYKKEVRAFKSTYVPHGMSYLLCWLWERFSVWSKCELPPVFNRRRWHAFWKKTRYSNAKLKARLGWTPRVSTTDGLRRYFEACRSRGVDA